MDNALALTYTGAWRDPVIDGLPLGNGHRTYLPDLMRFTTPDHRSPFGEGGINPYAYCSGDPINFSDPSGQFQISWTGALGIVAAIFGLGLAALTGGSALAVLGAALGTVSAFTGVYADNSKGTTHDALMGLSILSGVVGGIMDAAGIIKSTVNALQLAGGMGRGARMARDATETSPLLRYQAGTGETAQATVEIGTSLPIEQWTLDELYAKGTWVGNGDVGKVYKVGDRAYKISGHWNGEKNWKVFANPERNAPMWNDFYSKAYDGQVAHLANARSVMLKSGETVLETPYIESTGIAPTIDQINMVNREFQKILGRNMMDRTNDGNILVDRMTGLPLPVDLDNTPRLQPPFSPATELLRKSYQGII